MAFEISKLLEVSRNALFQSLEERAGINRAVHVMPTTIRRLLPSSGGGSCRIDGPNLFLSGKAEKEDTSRRVGNAQSGDEVSLRPPASSTSEIDLVTGTTCSRQLYTTGNVG